jgi:methylated-DNA-[protein]-cysteine S-methyltransferase
MIKHSFPDFTEKVIGVVRGIRRGNTMTYGEVATKAGHPLAARAVGAIMRSNKDKKVPCHRVVAKNGLGGYNGLQGKKRALLIQEGALSRRF